MSNRPLEEQLRERLGQHLTPIDTDALWDKVEPRLPKKRKPIMPFWIWGVSGLALLAGLSFWHYGQGTTPKPIAAEEIPMVIAMEEASVPDDPLVTASTPKLASPVELSTPANAIGETISRKLSPSLLPQPITAPAVAPAKKEESATIIEVVSQTDIPEISENLKPIIEVASTTNLLPIAEEEEPMQEARLPLTPKKMPEPANVTNSLLAEKKEVTLAKVQAEQEIAMPEAKANKDTNPKKIKKQGPPAYWTIESGIALSLPSRTISGGGEQGQINGAYEKALEGISVQGLVGYHQPSGFSLRTGLVSSRINSKVESEITTLGFDNQQGVVAIIVSPNGSRREQVGTLQVTNETVTTTKYYNAVNSLDVPLLLGYRFQGSKLGLTLEAGPTFNLSSSGSAQLYDGNGGYRNVSNGHFRQKTTGLGMLLNFGGAYNLTEQTMLTANLRVQSFGAGGFEDIDITGYSTQYTLIGIQLGYRIKF